MNKFLASVLAVAAIFASSSAMSAETYGNLVSPPGVYFGAGNPNGNFNITTANGLELGLRVKNRSTVGPALIDGSSGVYSVAAGACGPTCGSGTKAKWNYEFSAHTTDGAPLSNYFLQLFVDHDPSALTNFTAVDPATYWIDNKTDGGLGIQNSQNVAFGDTPGGAFNLNATGLYDFRLVAYSDAEFRNELASVDITVQVPEPASIGLLGLGLVSMAALRRRKAKQA